MTRTRKSAEMAPPPAVAAAAPQPGNPSSSEPITEPPHPLPHVNPDTDTVMDSSDSAIAPNPAVDGSIKVHKRIRAPALEKLFEKTVKASTSGITLDNWNKCFPTPCSKRPEQMKVVRTKFLDIYENNVRLNFEQILASRRLLASLDNLDILVAEATERAAAYKASLPPVQPTDHSSDQVHQVSLELDPQSQSALSIPPPPPPLTDLTPDDLYTSHLNPLLQQQHTRLLALQSDQQALIDSLILRKREQGLEITRLIEILEGRLKLLDEASEGVKEINDMEMDVDG